MNTHRASRVFCYVYEDSTIILGRNCSLSFHGRSSLLKKETKQKSLSTKLHGKLQDITFQRAEILTATTAATLI
jgi:hypothetical protein